jgi:hypothetical protein
MWCASLLVIFLGFWTATLFAGIALANSALGRPAKSLPDEVSDDQHDDQPGEPAEDPPLPNVFPVVGIVALTAVVNAFVTFGYWAVVGGPYRDGDNFDFWRHLPLLPVLHLIAAGILAGCTRLPFGRAWLAVLFQYLIVGLLGAGLYALSWPGRPPTDL